MLRFLNNLIFTFLAVSICCSQSLGDGEIFYDDFEYSSQTELQVQWPADDLVAESVALNLSLQKNLSPLGYKSASTTGAYEASRHYFGSTIASGMAEIWFYDPGDNAGEERFYADVRAGGAYMSLGVNKDTLVTETRYFMYLSNPGWQYPVVGPLRSKGWHQLIFTFGDTSEGGAIYLDGTKLATNSDMIAGCESLGIGCPWPSSTEAFYFDEISIYGGSNLVDVSDAGNEVTLDNGIISVKFNKLDAQVTSLKKASIELLGGSWGWYFQTVWDGIFGNAFSTASYNLVRQSPFLTEIAFRHDADSYFPYTAEMHYVLRTGDSGVYSFVTMEYNEPDYSYLEQFDYVLAADPAIFSYHAVDDDRQDEMPTTTEMANGTPMYAGVHQLPDGSYYDKYHYSAIAHNHHLHGIMGSYAGTHYGLWSISPNNEYTTGGPQKQELTVHQTSYCPVVLQMLHGRHYGSYPMEFYNEYWGKIYGPYFFYVNSGSSTSEIWANAQYKSDYEVAVGVYPWMDNALYPLQRGAVHGKLIHLDGTAVKEAVVLLAKPDVDWQKQGKDYISWSETESDGTFIIENVREDTYTLYAYDSNTFGQHRKDEVAVVGNVATELGDLIWEPVKRGRLIWQIGTPDRTAAEYLHGDDYRHPYLWQEYPIDFPDDVNFIIGVSDEATEWNYVQPVVDLGGGNSYLPTWYVRFDLSDSDIPVFGEGTITLGLASAAYTAGLEVYVNGTLVAKYNALLPNDGACLSAGIFGFYREKVIDFDTSLLHSGTNTVSLLQTSNYEYASIMYDSLKLELRLKGDINLDGFVGYLDLAELTKDWLSCTDPLGDSCVELAY